MSTTLSPLPGSSQSPAERWAGQILHMTESEFLQCDLEPFRGEWVDGEVVLMNSVNRQHLQIQNWLNVVLLRLVEVHHLGFVCGPEFPVRWPDGKLLRVPDLFFVRQDRADLLRQTCCDGAPDLIIEIVSPESVSRDWRVKHAEYEALGVQEYWVVDPLSEVLEAYTLHAGRYELLPLHGGVLRSIVLPGFSFETALLWQTPLPSPFEWLKAQQLLG